MVFPLPFQTPAAPLLPTLNILQVVQGRQIGLLAIMNLSGIVRIRKHAKLALNDWNDYKVRLWQPRSFDTKIAALELTAAAAAIMSLVRPTPIVCICCAHADPTRTCGRVAVTEENLHTLLAARPMNRKDKL